MSAFANSPAAPQPDQPGTPKPVASKPDEKPSQRKWWIGAAVVIAVAAGAWALRPQPVAEQANAMATVKTTKVTVGSIQRTLRVSGSTTARNFANIVAP